MANAMTEHSKALRAKTAKAHTEKMRAEGKIKQIGLSLPADLAAEFDAVLAELGDSRVSGIRALCAFYRENKKLS